MFHSIFSAFNFSSSVKLYLTAISLAFWVSAPVLAQDSVAELEMLLAQEKAQCKSECRAASNGEMVCEVICGCTMKRFSNELNLEEYKALKQEIDSENLSEESARFLDQTAAVCVLELDRMMQNLEMPPETD